MTAKAHAAPSPILDVFPYLCVRGAPAAIDFYVAVFGAEEITRLQESGGRIVHAELRFGPVTLMLADELPEYGIVSPQTVGFGHEWLLGHELEKLSDEEIRRRFESAAKPSPPPRNA
jgi:uncharacterized glyoxalase superfamily protein PhnB